MAKSDNQMDLWGLPAELVEQKEEESPTPAVEAEAPDQPLVEAEMKLESDESVQPKVEIEAKVEITPRPKVKPKAKPKRSSSKRAAPKRKVAEAAKGRVKRDLFSMPEHDYALIQQIRQRAMRMGVDSNKSEVIRAGLRNLISLDDAELEDVLSGVERMKPGRRAKVETNE
ncbi:hypothetical protein BOW53_07555 [Solemya pervernicosa gill symbiont]|uniref:Uncharacterized protein n=1 Tax=Solemya pervernicosa gill symbiont TaxID=642797 RepID=A0A1T2L6C7_9GAMM|nr:hypothetical protein [Solemya pervernicosa gill symbiont]OOZ40496.1 hypothetical protein BOW53_07555 [Solemya pervernicosa gill symbiont]